MIKVNCRVCKKEFETYRSLYDSGHKICCSRECSITLRKSKPAWNKGKKLHYKVWNKGIKRNDIIGEKHPNWKGNEVGYQGVHQWIRKVLGNPKECWNCKDKKAKKYEWANISKKYKRDIFDWKRLCVSCHRIYDDSGKKAAETRRILYG